MALDQSTSVELSSRVSFVGPTVLVSIDEGVEACIILVVEFHIEALFIDTCRFNLGIGDPPGVLVITVGILVVTVFIVDDGEGETVEEAFSGGSSSILQIFELKSGITATIRKQTIKISTIPQIIVSFLT